MAKNEVVIKFLGDDSRLNKVFKNVEAQADGFNAKVSKGFSGLKLAAGAAFAGAGVAAIGFGKSLIDAAVESQKVTRQTEAVLKSMGGVAGVTAGDVGKLANSLSMMSGVDDEVIQSAQNVLLTFGNVRNEIGKGNAVFDRATTAALDMSVALGTDMQGATIQVGKALNDPIKGITALSRAGVSFSKEQQETIKTLVKQGDTLGAQKIILKELENQFGGSAKAQATAGERLKVIWGNLQEELGAKLLPVVEKVATFLADKLPGAFAAIGNAVGPIVEGVKLFFNAFRSGFTEDEGTRIEGIALLFREKILPAVQAVRDFIGEAVAFIGEKFREFQAFAQEIFPQVQEAIGHFVSVVSTLWNTFGDDILRVVTEVWSQIQVVIETVIGIVQNVIRLALAIINGDWGKAWDALKGIVTTVWDGIKATIGNAIGVILGVLGGVGDAVRRVARGMWDGIKDAFKSAINFIINGWNRLEFKVPSFSAFGKTIGGFTLGVPDITPLAKGGIVRATPGGSLILAGEGGKDEAVVPLPRHGGLMGGITVVVQTGQSLSTDRDIEDAVRRAIEGVLGRGGSIGDGRGRYLQMA